MTASTARQTGLARRYASALFELAESKKAAAQVGEDLASFMALVGENEELANVVLNPLLPKDQVAKALSAVAKKAGAHELTVRFIEVIAENRRLGLFDQIEAAYAAKLREKQGELTASVITATPLSAANKKELEQSLSKNSGKKVQIEETVDATILGGLIVQLGSKRVDASVAGKLERLAIKQKQANVL
ncbi:MAG: F0F1 ATP synthase subunit delta [Proteobacteria bacterium]|nr:F0F1 ATP synthase subunit delta [Pseudomonadota bacterium]